MGVPVALLLGVGDVVVTVGFGAVGIGDGPRSQWESWAGGNPPMVFIRCSRARGSLLSLISGGSTANPKVCRSLI